jgi:hypothetical protein
MKFAFTTKILYFFSIAKYESKSSCSKSNLFESHLVININISNDIFL